MGLFATIKPMAIDPDEIVKKITAFRDARDWKQFHNAKDMALEYAVKANPMLQIKTFNIRVQ